MRAAVVVLAVLFFGLAGGGLAEDRAPPRLVDDLLALVREHTQGKERYVQDDERVTISFDAMTFQVHRPNRVGRLQKADTELGPNTRGVVLEFDPRLRAYDGPMELPQRLRGPYYDTYCAELHEGDRYIFVRARFGERFPAALRERVLERVGAARTAPPPFDMWVTAKPRQERFAEETSLRVSITLYNGLRHPVRWSRDHLELAEVRRDGKPCGRPEAPPGGVRAYEAAPRGRIHVPVDLRRWTIPGGWVAGTYDVTLRLRGIRLGERITLAVSSGPVRVVIEPPATEATEDR
jgi:hypothetical protein